LKLALRSVLDDVADSALACENEKSHVISIREGTDCSHGQVSSIALARAQKD
jgi:hypothetical protein